MNITITNYTMEVAMNALYNSRLELKKQIRTETDERKLAIIRQQLEDVQNALDELEKYF